MAKPNRLKEAARYHAERTEELVRGMKPEAREKLMQWINGHKETSVENKWQPAYAELLLVEMEALALACEHLKHVYKVNDKEARDMLQQLYNFKIPEMFQNDLSKLAARAKARYKGGVSICD